MTIENRPYKEKEQNPDQERTSDRDSLSDPEDPYYPQQEGYNGA